jgi:hypothetical protein
VAATGTASGSGRVADSELLTSSRMACARACLRRHQYAYELGLRAVRESSPLRLGTAFHLGLATAYALLYVGCVLALATAAFETRDFK